MCAIVTSSFPFLANFGQCVLTLSVYFRRSLEETKQCLSNRGLYRHNDVTLVHVTKLDIQIHNIICLYYIF